MTGLRILVTGSRDWRDRRAVGQALVSAIEDHGAHLIVPDNVVGQQMQWERVTVVHGDCPRGADRIASRIAEAWGMQVEAHPADWARYGRAAGHRRNAEMVALGADLCVAFPLGESRGTRDCIRRARAAGIPVVVHEGGS